MARLTGLLAAAAIVGLTGSAASAQTASRFRPDFGPIVAQGQQARLLRVLQTGGSRYASTHVAGSPAPGTHSSLALNEFVKATDLAVRRFILVQEG